MVFSSISFLFLFLPITVVRYYYILNKLQSNKLALTWLAIASLFFYGYWKPSYLWIIIVSIIINYNIALLMSVYKNRKLIFLFGLLFNIGILLYFKYTNFLITNLNRFLGVGVKDLHILLPIGISFYTFQQIAFLTDIYRREASLKQGYFLQYSVFVSFFPQLIAGPIVHHDEVIPQLEDEKKQQIDWKNIYLALCFLSIGIAKKILIADRISPLVQYVFDIAPNLTFLESLLGALSYTLQLYFDFSGYADMAVGLGLFFNIKLPQNFNSPYKATSIKDFWRRWHITLSRWLQKYLYIPLGGNKGSFIRTLINLFITFLIGGIWHGAGWTFILWGILHGGALVVHRVWENYAKIQIPKILSQFFTFSFVCIAWIPFRASYISTIKKFVYGFLGTNGWMLRKSFCSDLITMPDMKVFLNPFVIISSIVCFLLIALFAKNTVQLTEQRHSKWFTFYLLIILTFSLLFVVTPGNRQEFIYFQF